MRNRWLWLLALPWIMTVSTESCGLVNPLFIVAYFEGKYQVVPDATNVDYGAVTLAKYHDLGVANDMAEALNEAHERRNSPPPKFSGVDVTSHRGHETDCPALP